MFWADEIAQKIQSRGQNQLVATGITPSGFIHVGNLREVTVGDTVFKAIEKTGLKAKIIYIADDFDRLRKRYPFLSEEYDKYIGAPLSHIPDPFGKCHANYAEHFLSDFFQNLPKLGIEVEKLSATELYRQGVYTELIKESLEKAAQIKKILEETSNRELPANWSPFNPWCKECGRIDFAQVTGVNLEHNKVSYFCECGYKGEADFSKGEGKLSWRVDWPARWKIFGVTVEPFGKEHAAAGGSYDTSKRIVQEVFNYPAPEPVTYEFIYLTGAKGKMSSSLGNVISGTQMLELVPPEVLRFFLIRNKDRHAYLDPGEGLIQLIDEFTRLETKVKEGRATEDEKALYSYSKVSEDSSRVNIPFRHLINVYQAAQGNKDEIIRLLKRTEHVDVQKTELLESEIERVANWLKKFAPESYKFSLQENLPEAAHDFSDKQRSLLASVADYLQKAEEIDPEELHNFIYDSGKKLGLTPQETFQPIYLSLIAKTSGPKAGWFINTLDKNFVIKRFREV